jgi:REP element-mobilizing transposase RayT
MSLFQIQVERQYLSGITTDLHPIYQKYLDYFGNAAIQANILGLIEQQYQGEFIEALFVNILGYTAQPQPNFNLLREKKNETDAKSADAAISVNNQIVAVIELKDHKTQDLKKIEPQAFGYKNNHKNCHYVVTSNFERLRFYIDNAVDFIEFNLFNLSFDEFRRLWLCLSYESIAKNLPQEIKNQSISTEDIITKQLYKDYSSFKRELFDSIVSLNPDYDKLLLFKKTQKLLDRFLFLLFAEDKQLLPANSVKGTVEKWKKFNDDPMNDYQSLYSRFVKYFKLLNEGYKDANTEIYAYNGGLFADDELLNSIKVEDAILSKNVLKIATYNFDTAVDVNILGHIFENSLNEIEQVANEINSGVISSLLGRSGGVSKRKQDGVFYTPRYITQYIVENTVGRLCDEKKTELALTRGHTPLQRKEKQALYNIFTTYREWLLQLTIVDPACGSGAFLNTALDFLIAEHKWIDNQQDKIAGLKDHYSMGLSNIENTILENNLFGVDINDESVEIAKLSLWLRTAKPHRKLKSLNNNIKCGNSLIDDRTVAGDKAFDWQKEFPQIFKQKEKKAWHITTATHNSRYSQRMYDNFVKLGEPVWLTEKEELIITRTIAEIAVKDQLNILAYNICGDHMHIALVCEEDEVEKIVGKLKSMSARAANIAMGRTISRYAGSPTRGHAPLSEKEEKDTPSERGETQTKMWTQKFYHREIKSEEELYIKLNYIRTNREKHGLPDINKQLLPLVDKMISTIQHAYRTEYKGGFDVVIGNPPYVRLETMKDISEAMSKMNYKTFEKRGDLYCLFVEKGFDLLKPKGVISFIMPNKWMQAGYGKSLREFFLQYELNQLIDFGDIQIFEGATTYPCIFVSRKANPKEEFTVSVLTEANKNDFYSNVTTSAETFTTNHFSGETWVISSGKEKKLLECINSKFNSLFEFIGGEAFYGMKTGFTEAFLIDESIKDKLIREHSGAMDIIKPVLRGRDINKWASTENNSYIIGTFPALNLDIDLYPSIKNFLLGFGKERLEQSGEKVSRKKTNNKWFETQDTFSYWEEFSKPKIMYQKFQVKPCFIYDEQGLYCNDSMWIIPSSNKGLLAILNSKMGWWLITKYCTQIQNGVQLIWKYFGQIPIANTTDELAIQADAMLSLNKELQFLARKFQRMLQRKLELEELPGKLQNWYTLSYKEFIAELGKKKIKLTLADEAQWEEYFLSEQAKALGIKKLIDDTDRDIDLMVYALYELTEEEVKIVEGKI